MTVFKKTGRGVSYPRGKCPGICPGGNVWGIFPGGNDRISSAILKF